LNEFGVRPAPLPDDIEIPEFMDWMETEFKALTEVIFGASDFAAAFSVESILKILHNFDCVDLEKFRANLPQFPSATNTAILRANTDVQAIKIKFGREFWLTSGKETVKTIVRVKLAEVASLFYFVTCVLCSQVQKGTLVPSFQIVYHRFDKSRFIIISMYYLHTHNKRYMNLEMPKRDLQFLNERLLYCGKNII
jgi:hypothetical protein